LRGCECSAQHCGVPHVDGDWIGGQVNDAGDTVERSLWVAKGDVHDFPGQLGIFLAL